MRVWTLLMLVCCVCALCPCVRVCVLCAASPLFSFGIFALLAAAADAAAAAAAAAVSCLYHTVPSSKALYFVAATVQQQSHMKLVSCCDGHGRCICVCACACQVCYRNEGIIISNLRGGQGDTNRHFLGISKATAHPQLQQRQQLTAAPALQTMAVFTAMVLFLFIHACSVPPQEIIHVCMHLSHEHIYLLPCIIK